MGTDVDVVVVGAGFAGMYALIRLRRLGFACVGIEAADDVGGTWWWNRYPGARCDIESLNYSYSFDQELEQEWEWTERFATQPEILAYANHVADRYDVRRDIRFGTRVTGATWDDDTNRWTVTTDHDEQFGARWLILAVGALSQPKLPEVAGLDSFAGRLLHTATWPHEPVDFTGRRVGVIGTGSSGIQAIPLIAQQAAHLTVFQRTPNFSQPAHNAPLDPAYVAARKADYPAHREQLRQSFIGNGRPFPERLAVAAEADELQQSLREGWDSGELLGVGRDFVDVGFDPAANDLVAEFCRQRIREVVADPAVAETLSPRHHYGTKRPCLDTDYYATFNQPHVDLVDLRTNPIVRIAPDGVETTDGLVELDDLVLATGFDALTGPLRSFPILGVDGRTLADEWADGPHSLLGIAVAGFPNAFIVVGPQSPSVLSNMLISIEQHVEWISDLLEDLRRRDAHRIEATPEAQAEWGQLCADVASFTLHATAESWYSGANVEGKPRVFLPYVGGLPDYRQRCDDVAADGYRGFAIT